MTADIPEVKSTDVLKGISWTAKACFVSFIVVALAAILYGVVFTGLNGLFFWLVIGVCAVFIFCFGIVYVRTKKKLDERRERLIEQSKTLAPVSPEWEKIRSEMNENKGKLVKKILQKRSLNPQQDLLSGFLKKK